MTPQKQLHQSLPKGQRGCVMAAGRPVTELHAGRPADNLKARPLTKWEVREIGRRQKILAEFNSLLASGLSQVKAAAQLRQSHTTLWRWKKRIAPTVHNGGRKTVFDKLAVPAAVVKRVQRLQLDGRGNAAAWRAVASEPICPPALAEFIAAAANIPPSLLKRTRVMQVSMKMIQGENFSAIQNP